MIQFTSKSSAISILIQITQIPCISNNRPPSGCFQYHTGLTGQIKTFNWDATTTANYQHLASQRYSICIRQEEGMCCVQYTLCDFLSLATGNPDDQPSWALGNHFSTVKFKIYFSLYPKEASYSKISGVPYLNFMGWGSFERLSFGL